MNAVTGHVATTHLAIQYGRKLYAVPPSACASLGSANLWVMVQAARAPAPTEGYRHKRPSSCTKVLYLLPDLKR